MMAYDLPRPGAPVMDNCIATILDCDQLNRRKWLNLDQIAFHQGFDAGEFRARFSELETAKSLQPRNCEEIEGK